MPDSLLLPICLDRLVDSNGDILALGTVGVFDAGTDDEKDVFTNLTLVTPAANPIVADAGGWLDARYIGTGSYKLVIKDSDGATVKTVDNLPGALDTSGFTPTFAKPDTPVINKASDYTIISSDLGKVVNVDPTGGAVVITLISAVTAGDGARITFRHVGTANQVTLVAVSGQTINGATSRALGLQYESVTIVSDGANWHIDGKAQRFNYGQFPNIYVESRSLLTPPVSQVAGARYIIAGSGTPTGLWAAYSNGDIAESDGQGGWIRLQPAEGWTAYDRAANQHCLYVTSWEGLPATDDPEESELGVAVFSHQLASGTNGGTVSASAWTDSVLNTTEVNNITGCSLGSNIVTLPAGTYLIHIGQAHYQSGKVRTRFHSTTTSKEVVGLNNLSSTGDSTVLSAGGFGVLTLTAEESFKTQYYRENTASGAATALGQPVTSGDNEVYNRVVIIDIASLQGPQGDQGTQGPQGFAGFKFQYSTTTTQTDPGAGFVRLNSLTLSSVTAAVIDATSAETGNPDVSDEIAAWDDTGILKIAKVASEQNWVTYNVTDVVDNGTHLSLTLTYRDHAGSFSNTDSISLQFIPKGETGATGTSVLALDYQWNTGTAGDPTSGKLLGNNAALASVTSILISDLDRLTNDVSAVIAAFDDSGASAMRGHLYIIDYTTQTNRAVYKVTGTVTDNTTYQTFSVTYVGHSGSFASNARVALLFVPAGATGAIGGTLTATDNLIVRTDGTGGATVQAGVNTIADAGNIGFPEQAAPSTPASAFVELYAKSDGRFYEKDDTGTERGLSSIGKYTIWIPAAAMWARTTNGPGAASRELTTGGDIMIKGWAFDTTTEEGVQFYIGFPKSWDKGTITFQAFWTNVNGLTTETVSWGLSAGAFTDSDAIDSTDLGTEVRVSDTWLAANDLHVSAESAAVTVGNTPIDDDLVIGQIVRSVANDNMTGDAELLGVKVFYTINVATDA